MNNNYFNYWYKRMILNAIKTVIGLGLSVGLAYSVNLPIGIMFFGWTLVDALLEKN